MISGLLVFVVVLLGAQITASTTLTTPAAATRLDPPVLAGGSQAAPSSWPKETSKSISETNTGDAQFGLASRELHLVRAQVELDVGLSAASSSNSTSDQEPTRISKQTARNGPVYTNQFVIRVEGGEEEARKLAEKHGFIYLNHILGDYYHLEHERLSKRSLSASQDALDISIQDEPQVSHHNQREEVFSAKVGRSAGGSHWLGQKQLRKCAS